MIMYHYVYVLQNENEELQTGYTLDLSRRVVEHNQEPTKPGLWRIVYCEVYVHLSDAIRRARHLKSIHGVKLIKQRLQRYLWR